MPQRILLDVSELEPPEPLTLIIEQLQRLTDEQVLQVRHRRDPVPLYPMLAEMGFGCRRIERQSGAVTLFIWSANPPRLADYCQGLTDDAD